MKATLFTLGVLLVSTLGFVSVKSTQPQPLPHSAMTFTKEVHVPVALVQVNTEWNKQNEYKMPQMPKNIKYIYIDLEKNPKLKEHLKIKSLPTIIVYKEGKETKRWEAGLQMKITAPFAEILKALN
jgi:hypothetical protein